MNVWENRFSSRTPNPFIESFNSSIHQDAFLFQSEINASLAFAKGLQKAGVLSTGEAKKIQTGLEKVQQRIEKGEDLSRFEDIHSAVELLLTEEIGDVGKKLHTGRSRNEQVVTAERLYIKDQLPLLMDEILSIQRTVVGKSEEYAKVIMPGYTHLQQGQCVLFSHYLMALFWQLERGKSRLRDTLFRMDSLPLGSGALAGSTYALDREFLKNELGFHSISENSMDAVADRTFILEPLFALSLVLLDISRYAEDFIIFTSQEFGYLELDESITTSSSLMPQKKNPDIFELVRGGAAELFSQVSQLFMTVKGIPSTYNKDLQHDKKALREGIDSAKAMLQAFDIGLKGIRPRPMRCREGIQSSVYATDLVDYLVGHGRPFREAHSVVGKLVAFAEKSRKMLDELSLDELHLFSPFFHENVYEVFDPEHSIRMKKTEGSTHPTYVGLQISRAKKILSKKNDKASNRSKRIA